jgi:hypothetical protein
MGVDTRCCIPLFIASAKVGSLGLFENMLMKKPRII